MYDTPWVFQCLKGAVGEYPCITRVCVYIYSSAMFIVATNKIDNENMLPPWSDVYRWYPPWPLQYPRGSLPWGELLTNSGKKLKQFGPRATLEQYCPWAIATANWFMSKLGAVICSSGLALPSRIHGKLWNNVLSLGAFTLLALCTAYSDIIVSRNKTVPFIYQVKIYLLRRWFYLNLYTF